MPESKRVRLHGLSTESDALRLAVRHSARQNSLCPSVGSLRIGLVRQKNESMIRTQTLSCILVWEKPGADALNQESGRIYSRVMVNHYRVYRQWAKVWLSQI